MYYFCDNTLPKPMDFGQLEELLKQRRWSLAVKEIKKGKDLSDDDKCKLVGGIQDLLPRLHPISICELAAHIAKTYDLATAFSILNLALELIEGVSEEGSKYHNERLELRMRIFSCRVRAELSPDLETYLFEFKSIRDNEECSEWYISQENHILLEWIGYEYYSKTGNIEESQKCLLNYANLSDDFSDIQKLVELSLVSKSFFDFPLITSLQQFVSIRESDIGKLFLSFQEGSFDKIKKGENELNTIVANTVGEDRRDEYMRCVLEKIYLINIVGICFKEENKYVPLAKFTESFNLSDVAVIQLILKLFGHGLVEGWIDTERGLLLFEKVSPRAMSKEEVSETRSRFVLWKNRVEQVIQRIRANK